MNSTIPKCNTLVFFDLETSGLPAFNTPKITELSFWSIERNLFLSIKPKEIPRVTNRLNLCVYPFKLIHPRATEITGLSNDNLEHQSPFNEDTANTVIGFLNRLKKPVCLIAHYGDGFDFPLLKSEIERLGKELPSHILCADSLPIFRELNPVEATLTVSETRIETGELTLTSLEAELSVSSVAITNVNGTPSKKDVNPFQYLNERTPVKRRLENQQVDGKSEEKKTKKPYRLATIYERIFNEKPEIAHHAEADVKMLMLVAANFSSQFLDKLDASAKPFASVKKLW